MVGWLICIIVLGFGNWPSVALSNLTLLSSRNANRPSFRRVSLDDLPGSRGQQVPGEVVDWLRQQEACNSTEIVQNVMREGCQVKAIRNRICFGVCMSIHTPGVPGMEEHDVCTQCRPDGKKKYVRVTLLCQGGLKKMINVPTVERCVCTACANPSG